MKAARLAALVAIAEAARSLDDKPDWFVKIDRNLQANIYMGDMWIAVLPHQCVASIEKAQQKRALFIATFCPSVVLELIQALAEAQAAAAGVK